MKNIAFALAVAPLSLGLATPASAQLFHRSSTGHHHFLRHALAGVAAYKIAKHTGDNRAAAGGHRNFLQRHPVLTGLGTYRASKHHWLRHLFHRGQ